MVSVGVVSMFTSISLQAACAVSFSDVPPLSRSARAAFRVAQQPRQLRHRWLAHAAEHAPREVAHGAPLAYRGATGPAVGPRSPSCLFGDPCQPRMDVVMKDRAPVASTRSGSASLAARAAAAMRSGQALVVPAYLSGRMLDDARADMATVMSQIAQGGEVGDFESIQTDLLQPSFREQMPTPVPFSAVLEQLDELRVALAEATGRSLLEGGGLHLMRYPVGSQFMRHVDEDVGLSEPVRNSISFLIYLTPDDWSADDGGSLQIFESDTQTPRQVLPRGGTLVLYDSTLEHEVLPTQRERHLISGRFRELDADWRRGRQVWQ